MSNHGPNLQSAPAIELRPSDSSSPADYDDRSTSRRPIAGDSANPTNPAVTTSIRNSTARGDENRGSSNLKIPVASGSDGAVIDSQQTIISRSPLVGSHPRGALPAAEIGRLLEGERLGYFELHEFVGGGGMGAVFRALDTMLNRTVAVKVLSQEQSGDEETLLRFKNEAQSAARLDHENISRVYYVGEDRGWNYIVFEFIEGTNLRDLIERQGILPLATAISYTLQIADALAHASGRDVVHRDIKPSNVLITPDDRAKLVDMGLARLHQVEPTGNDLTASGVTLGTFDYISPEQARDPRNADVRSDIYSLGCTLYFMLTGRPPFPDGTVLQKLLQHQGDEPPDPRTFRNDLPSDLLPILRTMMAKSPARRYPSPAELCTDLVAFANRNGIPAVGSSGLMLLSTAEHAPVPWRRHLTWGLPLAILLVVVGLLQLWWAITVPAAVPPRIETPSATQSASPGSIPNSERSNPAGA
ncbi:MAG: serine/threonine protein kinase [Pirellulales bacterium]|nr:serine/threonine protein kinase [Pirellulales bacterium]